MKAWLLKDFGLDNLQLGEVAQLPSLLTLAGWRARAERTMWRCSEIRLEPSLPAYIDLTEITSTNLNFFWRFL